MFLFIQVIVILVAEFVWKHVPCFAKRVKFTPSRGVERDVF
jgi:hypothetical protein